MCFGIKYVKPEVLIVVAKSLSFFQFGLSHLVALSRTGAGLAPNLGLEGREVGGGEGTVNVSI